MTTKRSSRTSSWIRFFVLVIVWFYAEGGLAVLSPTLTLDVSQTAAAPGDQVVISGELFIPTFPPEPLPDSEIEISVTAPDGFELLQFAITDGQGRFFSVADDFTQQGLYKIEASFGGKRLLLASETVDVSVVGDVQLLAPTENLEVFTSVVFRWEPFLGRGDLVYDLEVAADRNFQQIVKVLEKLDTTTAQLNLETQTEFYWRVLAYEPPIVPGQPYEFLAASADGSLFTGGGDGFEGIITGLVTSNQGGQALGGANVVDPGYFLAADCEGTNCSSVLVTGPGGEFVLFTQPGEFGPSTVTVGRQGFQDATVPVNLPPRIDEVPGTAAARVTLTAVSTCPPGRYSIAGEARQGTTNGTPLGVMAIAGGVSAFAEFTPPDGSGPNDGKFELDCVPLDAQGKIDLQAYADGFDSYIVSLFPDPSDVTLTKQVIMTPPPAALPPMVITREVTRLSPTTVSIRGRVTDAAGTGVVALVLVNGVSAFTTADRDFRYTLEPVFLDPNGQYTLFSFAFGFAPFKMERITPP